MLDTNMASYAIKDIIPRVRGRLLKVPMAQVSISAVTEAELRFFGGDVPTKISHPKTNCGSSFHIER
jgi:hypothetical protein